MPRKARAEAKAETEAAEEWTGPMIAIQFLSADMVLCRINFDGASEPQIATAGTELETVARLMREHRIWEQLEANRPQRKLGFV